LCGVPNAVRGVLYRSHFVPRPPCFRRETFALRWTLRERSRRNRPRLLPAPGGFIVARPGGPRRAASRLRRLGPRQTHPSRLDGARALGVGHDSAALAVRSAAGAHLPDLAAVVARTGGDVHGFFDAGDGVRVEDEDVCGVYPNVVIFWELRRSTQVRAPLAGIFWEWVVRVPGNGERGLVHGLLLLLLLLLTVVMLCIAMVVLRNGY
jgi:hypothetical protein